MADVLLTIYDAKMKDRPRTRSTESPLTAQEENEVYRVTLEILRMARERARAIPFFLFNANQLGDREASLCVETGITCIPGVWDHVERQKARGVTVEVVD